MKRRTSRQRQPSSRRSDSQKSSHTNKPSSYLLDQLLNETEASVTKTRRRRKIKSTTTTTTTTTTTKQFATLHELTSPKTKDLQWESRNLSYSNGNSWYERLNSTLSKDIQEQRNLFLIEHDNSEQTTPSMWLSNWHSTNSTNVIQQWWGKYGDYGAPNEKGNAIVLSFIDDVLKKFIVLAEEIDNNSSNTSPSSPSAYCTRIARHTFKKTRFLLIATLCTWCLKGREAASKYSTKMNTSTSTSQTNDAFGREATSNYNATNIITSTSLTNNAFKLLIKMLRTSSNLPINHTMQVSETLLYARLISSMPIYHISITTNQCSNSTRMQLAKEIAEAAMLSITSTSTASCGCSKCAFTITSHGILDHCPVRNLMQTGLNVKLLLCKCLKLSNDLTTYSLLWKNVLNKIITNQKEVNWKFKRRLLCTRTFVKVFEDATELPNDCLDIIFAYLKRDVTRYGKVLYRNDLGCQWTVDELSLKNYFNRSASTK